MKYFIPQMEPWFDESEINAMVLYMQSGGWLTEYKQTRKFEDLIADYTGAKHCIVVNNGIVLVDYTNQLRHSGMERTAALLQASKVRFRPVFMTALTTISGMIPLTFNSSNEMSMSYQSFGFTLIGGMTSATLFTLLAVPVFYTLIDDAQKAFRNTLASVLDRSPKPRLVNE